MRLRVVAGGHLDVVPAASSSAIRGRKNGTWGEFETSIQTRTADPRRSTALDSTSGLQPADHCDYLM